MLNLFKSKKKNGDTAGNNERSKKKIKRVLGLLKDMNKSVSEINMIESILKMDYLTARDVMIPRIDVVSLNLQARKTELNKFVETSTFSRIPVYEGNIDNIKGIIHVKDLFKLLLKTGSNQKINLDKLLSDPFFVPEAKKISELLNEFQMLHQHLAVVVDEYGGFSGIVTFEDILEVFIGDIQDEFDMEQDEIKKLDDKIFSIDARTDLETFNKYFNLELTSDEADSIGGYLIMHAGYIPKLYQVINIDNIKFKVISKRKNSLIRLRAEFKTVPDVQAEPNGNGK